MWHDRSLLALQSESYISSAAEEEEVEEKETPKREECVHVCWGRGSRKGEGRMQALW